MKERGGPGRNVVFERLDRLVQLARVSLSWERLWPRIVPLLALGAMFLALSWAGLWIVSPRWLRIAGLGVFALLFGYFLFHLVRVAFPSRADSLKRLDRDSGLLHRPASTLEDRLANDSGDPATRALWELHLERAERALGALKVSPPSPRVVDHDRYALRAAALVALVAAAFMAGPEKYARVLAAFDWRSPSAQAQAYRLDAWIDPPAYTGRPPILLNTGIEGAKGDSRHVQAPAGSSIVVRASATAGVTLEAEGGLQLPKPDETAAGKIATRADGSGPPPTTSSDEEHRWLLRSDGRLVLRRYGSTIAAYDITSVPDRAPVITLRGEPKSNARGSLTLGYKVEDDYGIIGAEAGFAKPVIQGSPVTGRSLVEPPKLTLALPAAPGGLGEGETTGDLSEHPWAGARVTMTLLARDEGGNEGLSDPVEMTLPQRTFVKPLARAIIEQRRNLILAPDDRRRVQTAMDALGFAPERFGIASGVYLGLRTISQRLRSARTDSQLLGVVDLMWEMALRLEDGDLSQAERDLRAAQQQLREALERGASPEELKRLMDQLRAALDKFVQEFAEQQMRDQQNQGQQAEQNQPSMTITPRDLQAMLDRMEDMARNGNTADAQRMLDQLQRMMENLQSARRRSPQNDAAREMNRSLNELDKLTREQQQLRDQTFQDKQRSQRQSHRNPNGEQRRGQQQGQPNQQDEADDGDDRSAQDGPKSGSEDLQRRQEALRQRLESLQKRMKQLGMNGEEGFDEAEEAMKEAEQGLGEGGQGQDKAVDAQGRALEGLRKGAQSLAQQMQHGNEPGQGQADGQGEGDPNGPMRQGRNAPNPDPLGRESRDRTYNPQSRYDPLGVPAAERAQRVLEELRRRLSDPSRPREELDYLERLLRRY
ncbi:MAG: hypothetical protein JWM36_4661 [Hyphomicrobiales bacterium]|nr:hypothetical protein [Hyphomicrobiales bacterium]